MREEPAGRRRGHTRAARSIVVLGDPAGWHVGRLMAAIAERGHRGTVVRWTELGAEVFALGTVGTPDAGSVSDRFFPAAVEEADAVIVRSMPGGGLEEVIFRMDLLGRLAARGTPVFNEPRALEVAIDKYLSLSRIAAAGLQVPRTTVAQTQAAVLEAWQSFSCDCIAKPLFGSQGRGLVRLADGDAVGRMLAASAVCEPTGKVAYLQEFVPNPGWDVRVLLIGNSAVSIRRIAAPNEWRTNVSLGGRPEPFDAPADWVDLAMRAARAVGAQIAGVDLLPANDGRLLVLEVNAVPGWRGLESATGENIAAAVIRHVESSLGGPPRP